MKPMPSEYGIGVGERLRERLVARELDDPELLVLVGPEVRREVVEPGLGGRDHPVEVVLVARLVVDLDRDVVPAVLLHARIGPTGTRRN